MHVGQSVHLWAVVTSLRPMLLIPGLCGTSLNCTVKDGRFINCGDEPLNGSWRMWLNLLQFTPWNQECWIDVFSLNWDGVNYSNPQGVDVWHDSGLEAVEYLGGLGDLPLLEMGYLAEITEEFIQRGHTREVDLDAFPFDWRQTPFNLDFSPLKSKLEKLAQINDSKVVVVCHSYGCNVLNYFLNTKVDEAWKDSHVDRIVSVAGAYGGSFKAVTSLLNGTVRFFPFMYMFDEASVQRFVRHLASLYALLPNPKVADLSIVNTDTQGARHEYDALTWIRLLPDSLQQRALQSWTLLSEPVLRDPGVPVISFVASGTGVNSYSFDERTQKLAVLSSVPGDDTLTLNSASWPRTWASTVWMEQLLGVNHMQIIREPTSVRRVVDLALRDLSD
ncbi:MAG: uncharacterized protein KVP18_001529 [Porospora cf. gigantea A]|uniref:uncharacterized protein n=1 Tax=Porospora cf. gigantea A TaxID=2853593 RepID=UPI00355A8308|nr:MAG: hypothetical protein KVP18_001529 [Porospora cf. gigantea A]